MWLRNTQKLRLLILDKRGEAYIDTVVKMLIAVVLGALVIAGIFNTFGDSGSGGVLDKLGEGINEIFNYSSNM